MLQTRSGRCPYCSHINEAEAVACAECGAPLNYASPPVGPPGTPRRLPSVPATGNESVPRARRSFLSLKFGLVQIALLAFVLCGVTVVAVSYSFGIDLPFLPAREESVDVDASHGTAVQDARSFRGATDVAWRANPSDDAFSPEGSYVVDVNMPHGQDNLEITLNSAWNLLDAKTRQLYAENFGRRWQRIHAPYRANFTLYDLGGNEIGGRTTLGTVWVSQDQSTAFDAPALMGKDINSIATTLGTPQSEATPAPGTEGNTATTPANAASPPANGGSVQANAWKMWQRGDKSLTAYYNGASGQVTAIYVASDDPARKARDKSRLLDAGNLQDRDPAYRVVFMHTLDAPRRYSGVEALPNPYAGRLPDNPGPESVTHTVAYSAGGSAQSATVYYINGDGKAVRADKVSLPWRKTVTVTGNPALWLAVDNEWVGQGDTSSEITVDGKSIAKDAGQDAVSVVELGKPAVATPTAAAADAGATTPSTAPAAPTATDSAGVPVNNQGTPPPGQ